MDVDGAWYDKRALALESAALSSFDLSTSALFLLSIFYHKPIFLLAGIKLVSTPPAVVGLSVKFYSGSTFLGF